jgi:hypothetical protein
MGFQLTICEGNEVGRQFDFDQPSVLLGRTHECDVPLYEAGVSRGHARIFLEGGVWLLEDLGSANGTLVNGRQVARHTLEEGDAITIGPVVLTWRPGPLDAATAGEPGVHHTRLLSVAEQQRSTSRALEMLSAGGPSEELAELAVRGAHEPLALQPTRLLDPGGAQLDLATREHDVNTAEAGLAALSPREEHLALTAAERARLKRQGALGRLWLWWAEASPRRKRVTAVSATLLLVGVVVSVAAALPNADPKQQPLEPTTLSSEPDGVSFGLGEGVTFPREDEKRFEFRVRSPVRVVAVLHYQCKDIARDEVTLTVNGHELGTLPADTLQVDERTHELLIPAAVISRTEVNTVVFDNTRHPPDHEPWRIWNVWLELAALPELDEAGLTAAAAAAFEKGVKRWEQREIGASNRWEAYRAFREAWLTLEALPGPRPATSLLARERMREVSAELDLKCRMLLLEARTAFSHKQYEQAHFALDHVVDFFPSRMHPCPGRADHERAAYEL